MEQFNLVEGSGSYDDHHQSGGDLRHVVMGNQLTQQQQMGSSDEKKVAAVDEEIKKVSQLPQNSNYATHRMRVLNKILQLLSLQLMYALTNLMAYPVN